jgi:DNA invertase Pin-like site-specific DNA recombinase
MGIRGPRPLVLTQAQVDRVTKDGLSIRELAKEVKRNYHAVRLALMRAGVKRGNGKKHPNVDRDVRIAQDVLKNKKSQTQVAREYGISPQRVSVIIKKHLKGKERGVS